MPSKNTTLETELFTEIGSPDCEILDESPQKERHVHTTLSSFISRNKYSTNVIDHGSYVNQV